MAKKPAAAKNATAPQGPSLGQLLAAAVQAVQTNMPMFSTPAIMAGLVQHPSGQLVEFNEGLKDANGNIAFRATQLGMQLHASGALNTPAPQTQQTAPQGSNWNVPQQGSQQPGAIVNPLSPSTPTPAATRSYQFEMNIPIPAARRGGRGSNAYGFEQMQVGQSFFIGKTDDNPNPAKRVASTVSSASKRLAPMAFIVRSVEGGARVWRTA